MLRIGNWACQVGAGVAVFLVMAMLLTGCATSRDRPSGQVANIPKDSLMLVFVREFSFDRRIDDLKAKGRILDCVRGEILRLHPKQRMVSFDQFRRTAFPDLQRESVPQHPKYFGVLTGSAKFREAIAPLDLRYVVFVGGVVETSEPEGGGLCAIGPGAACFAYWEWDSASRMGATVFDLKKAQTADRIEASASGKAWFAIVGVFPIGLPSLTSETSCKDLGVQIARFLASEQNPAER